MIYVGIDVSKDKHDCVILDQSGNVMLQGLTIPNNRDGFTLLQTRILSFESNLNEIKIGLESTGHYGYNLQGYLLEKGFSLFILNPINTNLFRKTMSLRLTKTDKIDAKAIALMLMSGIAIKPYTELAYHNDELKSLTRYRYDRVKKRSVNKVSVSRLVNILFPELEKLVPSIHSSSVYALLDEFPGASRIASANIIRLTNILQKASKGRYLKDRAILIREVARNSVGMDMPAKSLELKYTIKLIRELDAEIKEIDRSIKAIMDKINSPILSIPGITYKMGAMIIAEIGDFSNFESPDKILAFSGCAPSIYQSGHLTSTHAKMEKRGSKYLRYALFNSAKYVSMWEPGFSAYLAKKRAEGKHYNVAVSHVVKRLVRLIYALEKSGQPYCAIRPTIRN